jgi:hypothetical protein
MCLNAGGQRVPRRPAIPPQRATHCPALKSAGGIIPACEPERARKEIAMTLDQMFERFPNGLDDTEITNLTIDYKNRTATLLLNLRANPPDGPHRDEYSRAVLTVRGFYYFSIDPPDDEHLSTNRSKITMDAHEEDPLKFPLFAHVKSKLPADAFCSRFYVHQWNSFIHVAAPIAELELAEAN